MACSRSWSEVRLRQITGRASATIEIASTTIPTTLKESRNQSARRVRGTRKTRQIFYEAADDHIRHMLIGMIEHVSEDDA